ncbi:UDP-N-acetylmuramate--L-alanine ligase [Candidatus Acetothermia bacterium]|nr:UDP-N-acetylmuramate--L-alanine ligase [Candidatus Acetothermia bacterium]
MSTLRVGSRRVALPLALATKIRMSHLHFVGIGGDGMSGLARVCWELGLTVTGSNIEENRRTLELKALGIPVYIGHEEKNLGPCDTVILSSAIAPANCEWQAAERKSLRVLHRFDLVRILMESRQSIGVGGTHGKTTTTAMVATLLEKSNLDPTYLIGAATPTLGKNAKSGSGPHLVSEIDESDGRFLSLRPKISVITNIGPDHLDHYRDEHEIVASFRQFIEQSDCAILCADDRNSRAILHGHSTALSFGITHDADLKAYDVRLDKFSSTFNVLWHGQPVCSVTLNVPGAHNVHNALAAMLAGQRVGLDFASMSEVLREFELPERRFQVLVQNGIMLVDDYAHLPEQIETNLKTIRAGWKPERVIALFQPHRYTRTHYINGRFGQSFGLADIVGVTDIYPAFEKPIPGVHADLIVKSIRARHSNVHYLPTKDETLNFLQQTAKPGDFIIGFGAGDIWKVLYKFADLKKSSSEGI